MTADDQRLDLDALEAVAQAATPGDWKVWGMTVMADQDGTSNVDTAVEVAHTVYTDERGKPRTFDATHIATFDPPTVLRLIEQARALRRVRGMAACHATRRATTRRSHPMTETPRTDTDRDALAEVLIGGRDYGHLSSPFTFTPYRMADTILASDWLAAHDAEVRRQALAPVLELAELLDPDIYSGVIASIRAAVSPDAADPTAHDPAEIKYPSPAAAKIIGQWIMSKEFKDSQHKMLNAAKERGWDEGKAAGFSVAMRRMSDEPNAPEPVNPYRADTIEADQ